MSDFGARVRKRRGEEGLSQEKLAQAIGISRNYLSQIERGKATNLSWQVMNRLTAVLGMQEEQVGDSTATIDQRMEFPPSLVAFAQKAELPTDDVLMLARLKYRGQQPTTPEKWELLYNVIKMTVES
ncbi:MAG: helix-turn-helix transcriptional regulator [Leptolyngbyaceae cyanobacterium MO_188.B28]|nr:helix-turn-helix transcriptional regulator [Leptolyngbyaceae cyanobacterium MO_188.B28]